MKTKRAQLLELAEPILTQLRYEAQRDDDTPGVPEVSPLDSAQAKRAQRLEVVA